MLSLLLGALSIIPGVTSAIQYVLGKKYDAQVAIVQAKTGLEETKAKQLVTAVTSEEHERTAKLALVAGNTLLTLLVIFFALPFGIFIWKVVVYDIVLQGITHGSTDPIKGQVADWGNTIIISIFGSSTAITLGKMFFSK